MGAGAGAGRGARPVTRAGLRECAQSPYRWANVCVGGGWVCTFMFTVIVKDAPHEGITEEGGWQP